MRSLTPPKHLSAEAKKEFRSMAKYMQELSILNPADVWQLEQAAVLIVECREKKAYIETGYIEEKERITEEKLLNQKRTTLNSTLDKLGISNTKRNNVKAKRGRPAQGTGTDPVEDKHRKAWLKAVK